MSQPARLPRVEAYDLPNADELPPAKPDWSLDRARAALLVHDMQRYFCRIYPEGQSPLAPAVANMARLIGAARAAGAPVFYTAQKGNQFRPDRGLQADFWGPGMQALPEHEEILPELAPESDDHVLVKHRYSAFQRSNLETLMRARGRDQLVICGVYAHIGCLFTAGEAFQRDIQPFLAADALADFSRDKHILAITQVGACCGIVATTDQIMERLT